MRQIISRILAAVLVPAILSWGVVAAAEPAKDSVNLLGKGDLTKPSGWGTPVSIPQDTGQFVVENGSLTLVRQRPAGDFKMYRTIEKLDPNTDYCLRVEVRVEGQGAARVGLLQQSPGGAWVWNTPFQDFADTGAWQTVEIRFRTPAQPMDFCLQLLPPSEVGGKVSFGPLLLLRAAALQQAKADEGTYPCFSLGRAPKLDGELDDPAWRLTPEVAGFSRLEQMASDDGLQVMPDGGQVAEDRSFVTQAMTFFQAGYTQDALYLAVRCYQPGADKLPVSKENCAELWASDCAEIHVEPGQGKGTIQFICNPLAARWPAEGWTVASKRLGDGWFAEVAIPFTTLGATPKPGEVWRVNVCRHSTTPRDELSTWAPGVKNFHDTDHFRRFLFKDKAPALEAKALAETALNQAFRASQQQTAEREKGTTEDRARTFFEIHTRNVSAALFVNGRRLSLKAKVWSNSYAGFTEKTLRAVAEIKEGENVVGIVAKADGPEPGIRMEIGRPDTDVQWKCAKPEGWEWLGLGYDDQAWSPIRPGEPRAEAGGGAGFFYWKENAPELSFRQVIRGVEKCRQDVRYGVADWKRDDLGSHRVIVHVPEAARTGSGGRTRSGAPSYNGRAIWAHIPWRRRDENPETKAIKIIDAKTGQPVKNFVVINCKREYGDIVFAPPTIPGDYEIYYLPYIPFVRAPWYWGLTDPYLTPFQEADPNWVAEVAWMLGDESPRSGQNGDIARANWQRLPRAEVVEIQAKTEFDRFDPMEVVATREEVEGLLNQTAEKEYLIFPEDRKFPVRMFQDLPVRWIHRGPALEFRAEAQPGEYYCFQLGVFAVKSSFSDLGVTFSDLTAEKGPAIPASAVTCFNLGGTDWLGQQFTQAFTLARGKIRALWIGVMVPEDAQGVFTGNVTVQPKGLPAQTVKVLLNVSGAVIANHGEDDLWRHARLRWLNSTLGLDDDWLVPPYTPLKMEGSRIECLDRSVDFGSLGLPEQVTSRGNAILNAPVRFVALKDGKPVEWRPSGKAETRLQKKGKIVREYTASADGITLTNAVTMEFDGCVQSDVTLAVEKDVTLTDVGLDVPFNRKVATYIAGANAPGGYRPASRQWAFDAGAFSNSKVWIGDVNAGMQLKVTEGQGRLEEQGDVVLVRTRLDTVPLTKDKSRHFTFRLLITPFKPINNVHWKARMGDPLKTAGPAQATIMHIHHASVPNPWINYPFLTADKLQELQKRIVAGGGLGVQLYYTVRELTNRVVELWALRSLGDEVLASTNRCYQEGHNPTLVSGHPWLREHLQDGFSKAWRTSSAGGIDAALSMRYLSRWHNYYVEGLNWLQRNKCFYSLYLDGIGYDREVMKRVARVMSKWNPDYRMEHHQCTSGTDSVANANLEHLPFVTALWYGENFNYNRSPDYWLVDVSGIPFGLTGEMLDNTGTVNLWRGMIYGLTGRVAGRENIWKLWDDFGIQDAEWIGYWDPKCPVKTDNQDVLATVYRKPGKSLIAIATWSRKDENVKLTADWKALGLDPAAVKLHAPAIPGMQEARTFRPDEPIPVKTAGGWFLIAENR